MVSHIPPFLCSLLLITEGTRSGCLQGGDRRRRSGLNRRRIENGRLRGVESPLSEYRIEIGTRNADKRTFLNFITASLFFDKLRRHELDTRIGFPFVRSLIGDIVKGGDEYRITIVIGLTKEVRPFGSFTRISFIRMSFDDRRRKLIRIGTRISRHRENKKNRKFGSRGKMANPPRTYNYTTKV